MFGSSPELMYLLDNFGSSEYVDSNFLIWLNFYPDIFNVMMNPKYNKYFDKAIRNNMANLLRNIIVKDEFNKIHELSFKYEKEIFENIDIILYEDPDFRDDFCELVYFESFEKCALEKQEVILQKALTNTQFKNEKDYNSNLLFLLSSLPFFSPEFANKYKTEIEDFLNIHFNAINPKWYNSDLLFLFQTMVMSSKSHQFIENFFNNHVEFIAIIFANNSLEMLTREKILDFYSELIKDIIRIENASITDMDLKRGAYSRTLIIKDKVLKSGRKMTKEIPYHKRILQPIVRQSINYIDYPEQELDFVEVYERVGNLKDPDDELVYKVFKEMLEDGVLLGDPHTDNLGVLLKPNKPYHEQVDSIESEFYIDNEAVGIYDTHVKKEILKVGEIVVCDVDCLYYYEKLKNFIKYKVNNGENVTISSLSEIGFKDVKFGASFQIYLDKYCRELKGELLNNGSNLNEYLDTYSEDERRFTL